MSAQPARQADNVVYLHDGIIEGEAPPLIPAGTYRAVYVRHDTVLMKMFGGAPKLFVHFRIVDPGEAFGLVLYRCYRVKRLTSKPGRRGSFDLAKRGELYLTLCRLTAARLRTDRVSLRELLRGRLLVVKVRTVTVDYQQRALPPCLHYSVIDVIVGTDTESTPPPPAVSSEQ